MKATVGYRDPGQAVRETLEGHLGLLPATLEPWKHISAYVAWAVGHAAWPARARGRAKGAAAAMTTGFRVLLMILGGGIGLFADITSGLIVGALGAILWVVSGGKDERKTAAKPAMDMSKMAKDKPEMVDQVEVDWRGKVRARQVERKKGD